jgi:hypothetical protein
MTPRIALPLVLLLALPACRHPHGKDHDDDLRTDEPGERHTVDDTGDAADSGPTGDTGGTDETGGGTDTGAGPDTGDADPAWTASAECLDAGLRLIGARLSVEPTDIVPGATFALVVTLLNASEGDDLHYPGVVFTSTRPDVTSALGSDWLYGLFAGQSQELGATFTVDLDAAAPQEVVLTATTTRLGCEGGATATPDGVPCPAACSLSYPLTIAAAP